MAEEQTFYQESQDTTDYAVICKVTRCDLQSEVNAMITNDYRPIGGVVRDSANGCFFQAMIKRALLVDVIQAGQD